MLYSEDLPAQHYRVPWAHRIRASEPAQELREGATSWREVLLAKMARATYAVYRSAVFSPSKRSLRTRRLLAEPLIIDWSEKNRRHRDSAGGASAGIRESYRALESAIRAPGGSPVQTNPHQSDQQIVRHAFTRLEHRSRLDCQVLGRSL